jgi:general stress protein YciG
MDPEKQRRIASKGGKAAHAKGRAHEWTVDEAREAGRKGGSASHRRHEASQQPPPMEQTPSENSVSHIDHI